MKFSRRWLWLLLLVPILLGLSKLRFDVEVLNLLPANLPVVQGLKLYENNFEHARELVITLRTSDAERTEFAAEVLAKSLRASTNLVRTVTWQPPWHEHPHEASEFVAYLWFNQPPHIFKELANRLSGESLTNTLKDARELLATTLSPSEIASRAYDPLNLMTIPENAAIPKFAEGQELFASADGTFRILFVEANEELKTYRDCIRWMESIKKIVEQARPSGEVSSNISIHYTGRPAFVSEIAGGMKKDIAGPSVGTLAIIALLFYFTHRCWRPLFWLLLLLLGILGLTLSFGGLLFGTLNVVSLGFASILLGLAEDFGIVLYQESRSHPEMSAGAVRKMALPGIFWSAVTTSGAFLLLNLSGLPGLGQLGSLVAIGIIFGAFVMLFVFLPPLIKNRKKPATPRIPSLQSPANHALIHSSQSKSPVMIGVCTVILFSALVGILLQHRPKFDHSPDALRPKNSPAVAAVEEMKTAFGRVDEPLWVLIPGQNEQDVLRRLNRAESILLQAASNQLIANFTLPTSLWPSLENQNANRATAKKLADQKESVRTAAFSQGFSTNSFVLTEAFFDTWKNAASQTNVFWPTNKVSHWIFNKFIARAGDEFFALGLIDSAPGTAGRYGEFRKTQNLLQNWAPEFEREGIILSGWTILSSAIFDLVRENFLRVFIPMLLVVLISLWLAFHSFKEIFLSLATLIFSGLFLVLIMYLAGWSWNLMNLMAIPLLLGMGIDFSIHIQLALHRHHGNQIAVRNSIGRALLLAGSTTVAGFASLIFSSNAGIASLGKVCAVGIVCAMLTAVYLVPVWWVSFVQKNEKV